MFLKPLLPHGATAWLVSVQSLGEVPHPLGIKYALGFPQRNRIKRFRYNKDISYFKNIPQNYDGWQVQCPKSAG